MNIPLHLSWLRARFQCKCSSILWFMCFCYVKLRLIANSLLRPIFFLFLFIHFHSQWSSSQFWANILLMRFRGTDSLTEPFILQCFWYSTTRKKKCTEKMYIYSALFAVNIYTFQVCALMCIVKGRETERKETIQRRFYKHTQKLNKAEIKKFCFRIFNILFLSLSSPVFLLLLLLLLYSFRMSEYKWDWWQYIYTASNAMIHFISFTDFPLFASCAFKIQYRHSVTC